MFNLNETILEVEIKSPSELIKKLENFKDTFINVEHNAEELIENKSSIVIGQFRIQENLVLRLFWRPSFDKDNNLINF